MGEEDYGEESPGTTQYRGQNNDMDMSYGGEEDSPDRHSYNYPKQMTESQGVGIENRLEMIKQNLKNQGAYEESNKQGQSIDLLEDKLREQRHKLDSI